MAYDEQLAERIRSILREKDLHWEEKKMMGGLCFMLNDKMLCGVLQDKLMARVGPENYEKALAQKGAKEMNFTKRPMKGFVFVEPEGTETNKELHQWIQACIDYNPMANSSKK